MFNHKVRPPWETYDGDFGRYRYCTDNLDHGLIWRRAEIAIKHRYVGIQPRHISTWIFHDVDRQGAAVSWDDAGVKAPNVIIINPENGHAHLGYRLATPVARHNNASMMPMRLLAAIERGMIRRLKADRGYSGLVAKNPRHVDWRTWWLAPYPYTLEELGSDLTFEDMRRFPRDDHTGLGRNCALFEQLRHLAYMICRKVKAAGGSAEIFFRELLDRAHAINCAFAPPLSLSEVRATCRSISKWTWRHISPQGFSAVQAIRGRRSGVKRGQIASKRQEAVREHLSDMVHVTDIGGIGQIKRLAQQFRVSERTIRRDLIALRARLREPGSFLD